MDERLAPEMRAVGSYIYFTGITARIKSTKL